MKEQHKKPEPAEPSQGGQSDKSESGFINAEVHNQGAPNTPREIPAEPDKTPRPPVKEIDQGKKPTVEDPGKPSPGKRA